MKTQFSLVILPLILILQVGCGRKEDGVKAQPSKQTIATVEGLDILGPGDEILDPTKSLVWQRCSLGENWNGTACEGTPKAVTFAEAEKMAPKGWRIPTIRELSSISDCASGFRGTFDLGDGLPAVNHVCAGNDGTPALHPAFQTKNYDLSDGFGFWSASADKSNDSFIRIIFFRRGEVNGLLKDERDAKIYVRYIRSHK